MNADALVGTASWKEEVSLHDGNSLIVERSQTYGAYPRIDSRERAVLEELWTFTVPASGQEVSWKNEFGLALDKSSLNLLALDFLNGVPYIAATPANCIAYNKWERPNPPYVFMRFEGERWQRIQLSQFPMEFNEANVAIGLPLKKNRSGTVSIDSIKENNRNLLSYLRIFVREPITFGEGNLAEVCLPMIYDGQGGWRSPDGFKAPQ